MQNETSVRIGRLYLSLQPYKPRDNLNAYFQSLDSSLVTT